MRFVNLNGVYQKARRFLSGGSNVSEEEVKDPPKLAEILRGLSRRVTDVEALLPPEAIEFEVAVGASGSTTTIAHNLGGPVRWYVVDWLQRDGVAYPASAPKLVQDASSTSDSLVLRSYATGRAIVRIEPAFAGVDPGITLATSESPLAIALSQNFTTTSGTPVATNLAFTAAAGESWRIHYVGGAGDSNIGGMKYAIGAPTGSTVDAWHHSSTTNMATRLYQQIAAINTLGTAVHTVVNGERDDHIMGVVTVGTTAGTISISAASVAGTATIYSKSSLVAHRVVLV